MGETLPVLDGLAFAAAHLPGPLGGTWYDIAPTDDGQVAVVVGNIGEASRDVAAQLCRAVAALGPERGSPSGTLAGLHSAARGIAGCAGSTALCVTLDPAGVLRWSGAGHSAPLVVGADGVRHLYGGQSGALARDDRASFPEAEETLLPGTTVVLGTDAAGLVGGTDPVTAALAQHHGLAPDALAALALVTAQEDGAPPSGTGRTLVLIRLMPSPLEQRLPYRTSAGGSRRRTTRGTAGRGLAVIHNLADEVDLEHSDRGTRIAFTVPGDAAPLEERPLTGVTQGWRPAGDGAAR
jgi:hypothetical protein